MNRVVVLMNWITIKLAEGLGTVKIKEESLRMITITDYGIELIFNNGDIANIGKNRSNNQYLVDEKEFERLTGILKLK